MRGLSPLSIAVGLGLIGCGPESEPLAQLGQACEYSPDCAEPLSCIESICVDDQGPALDIVFPSELDAVELGGSFFTYVSVIPEREPGDAVALTFDPHGPNPITTRHEWADNDYPCCTGLGLAAPLEPGPHWLRVALLDDDGQPYANPSATKEVLVFVRDGVHPDKPSVALLEPRPGHVHPIGHDLTFVAAVLPGTFAFSSYGEFCEPLPDCADPFAPECEDECGPVSRFGGLVALLDQDLPACTLDQVSCALSFVARPDEQLDAIIVRGTIDAAELEAGDHELAVMLVHDYAAYPSEAAPIYTTQPLRVE
jgi:hypothetical protein